jgi:2-polyprenyl-3-methyl-5-hydroxy-6-metoxy-1,4-benzoquinol methylase
MNERDTNRRHWDERARVHPETDYYDVEGFLAGESSLWPLEREELGPHIEPGTELLHLQCHFGMDTLSWAREGASVTGVDFSPEAVTKARELAALAGLDAEFVEGDVLDLDLGREFEVVFTSYGVLTWLDDLQAWAETVARHLEPGGRFYIAEIHPFSYPIVAARGDTLTVEFPYFDEGTLTFEVQGSYADPEREFEAVTSHEWSHPIGEIVTALCAAGLRIEFLHEHPWTTFEQFPGLTEDEVGRFWPDTDIDLPLTFSLQACRP